MGRLCWLLAAVLTGCAWLVPDKEKEYLHHARQLPPLRIPESAPQTPRLEALGPAPAVPTRPPPPLAPPQVGKAPFIELPRPFSQAWVSAIEALNRERLEITDRDPRRGVLRFFHSEAEAELARDRGMWEDLLYFFGQGARLREHEYQLVLQPAGDEKTRLYLFDAAGRPLTDAEAMKLLKRLQHALESDDSP